MNGYVEITLDKTRRLHYDANAICDLEDKLGKPIGAILGEETAGLSTVRGLLWAGLKHEERGLTIERAGRLLNDYIVGGGDQKALGVAFMQALRESRLLGKPSEDGDGDEGNAEAEAAK